MSAPSSLSKPLQLPISAHDLDAINTYLEPLSPEQILKWAVEYLPALYQTTAFGLTGLVAIDMLSKLIPDPAQRPPLIFLDTLYHFQETYELVERVKGRYGVGVEVWKPDGCASVKEFEEKYGERAWESSEELYDYLVKVRIFLSRCTISL